MANIKKIKKMVSAVLQRELEVALGEHEERVTRENEHKRTIEHNLYLFMDRNRDKRYCSYTYSQSLTIMFEPEKCEKCDLQLVCHSHEILIHPQYPYQKPTT